MVTDTNVRRYVYLHNAPLSVGDAFQDPQWMPKTTDSAEDVYTMFFPMHTYL